MENVKLCDLKNKRFHFVGIGGISMSALAWVLMSKGIFVQGSDLSKNDEVKKLESAGVEVFDSHKKENVESANVVVFTSAIDDQNPELVEARNRGLILLKRAELLSMIASENKNVIAVSGSHGKTTTTAMIAEVFEEAGFEPSYQIGGVLCSSNSNFKIGKDNYFIVEACEYKDNFLFLKPDTAVVLNVDSDHLDYFKSLDGVKESFKKFVSKVKSHENVFVCADDKNSNEMISEASTFGTLKKSDFCAINIKEYKPCYFSFDVLFKGFKLGNVKLNILGQHNVFNALAVVAVCMSHSIRFEVIKNALENFSGVRRRCELVAEVAGVKIFHDYAHHPKQIEKMVAVGKKLVKKTKGKVVVVFEPHTYSRTKFLIDEFVDALIQADHVLIAPVYSARELPEMGYDSLKLANDCKEKNRMVEHIETYEDIKKRVDEIVGMGDVVLILGAGTIEKLARMWG